MAVEEIKKLCGALEVNAGAHREEEEREEESPSFSSYLHSLKELSVQLTSLGQILEEENDQSKRRAGLKELVPPLIMAVAPHCGKHYWTTAETRRQSRVLLTNILHVCGCGSVLELLIGELPSDSVHVSPYLQVEGQQDNGGPREESSGEVDSIESSTTGGTDRVMEERDLRADGEVFESDFQTNGKDEGVTQRQQLGKKVTDGSRSEQSLETKQKMKDVGTMSLESPFDTSSLSAGPDVVTMVTDTPKDSCAMVFRSGLLKTILLALRPRLNKENWKKSPNAKHTLVWCLRRLKHPHVSNYLNSFLPPLLMLLDDHEVYHKVLGLSAVTHLIKNTDPTELRWYGRAEVIYEAVKTFLYMSDVDLIVALHPCLLVLLPVLEGPTPRSVTGPRKPSRTDEVFAILLNSLDFESKIENRKAYLTALNSYIKLLGIFTTRHMKRLLPVLYSCLEFPDYSGELTRRHTLRTLATLITYTWPRIPFHADEILKVLLKLVSDLCPAMEEIPDKQEVLLQLPLITECLVLLARCCGRMLKQYEALQSGSGHKGLQVCLENCIKQLKED